MTLDEPASASRRTGAGIGWDSLGSAEYHDVRFTPWRRQITELKAASWAHFIEDPSIHPADLPGIRSGGFRRFGLTLPARSNGHGHFRLRLQAEPCLLPKAHKKVCEAVQRL